MNGPTAVRIGYPAVYPLPHRGNRPRIVRKREDDLNDLLLEGFQCVSLDLSGVHYIDSSGISTILAGYKRFQIARRKLSIDSSSPRVDRLLNLLHMHFLKSDGKCQE